MKTFLKIVATFFFLSFWNGLSRGCSIVFNQPGASVIGSLIGHMSLLTLLIRGIYEIWKYKPNKTKDENDKLDKS